MEVQINWIAVLLATIAGFAVGGVWYGPLFGKAWQKIVGLKDKELEAGMVRVFGTSFVLTFIMAVAMSVLIGDKNTISGLVVGLVIGIGVVAMAFGVNYLFEHRSLKFYLINAGYSVVVLAAMGAIIGAM